MRDSSIFKDVHAVKRKDKTQDYGQLVKSIKAPIVTFSQLADPDFVRPAKCLVIRHDVDKSIKQAVAMAEVEKNLGIKSTYFLLHSAPYFQPGRPEFDEAVLKIVSLGHHIGIHNDAITVHIKFSHSELPAYSEGPPGILRKAIESLRNLGIDVLGTACHGAGECYKYNYRNYEMFTEFDPCRNEAGGMEIPATWKTSLSSLGLLYAAYLTNRPDYYLSDSHGKWYGVFVGNLLPMAFERTMSLMNNDQAAAKVLAKKQNSVRPYLKTDYKRDIVTKFNKGWHTDGKWEQKPRVFQLLAHPLHWRFM